MKTNFENFFEIENKEVISSQSKLFYKLKNSAIKNGLYENGAFQEGTFFYFNPKKNLTSLLNITQLDEFSGENNKVKFSLYGYSNYFNQDKTLFLPKMIGFKSIINQPQENLIFLEKLYSKRLEPILDSNYTIYYDDLNLNKKDINIKTNFKYFNLDFLNKETEFIFANYFPKNNNLVTKVDKMHEFLDLHRKNILKGLGENKLVELEYWYFNNCKKIKQNTNDLELLRYLLNEQFRFKKK